MNKPNLIASTPYVRRIIPTILTILLLSEMCFAALSPLEKARLRVFALFRIERLVWQSQCQGWLQLRGGATVRSVPISTADSLTIRVDSERLALEQRRGEERTGFWELPVPLTLAFQGNRMESEFLLSVPGRILRCFRGALELRVHQGELIAIVIEELEQLVGEVTAAEMSSPALPAAVEAQAIAARSFLVTHRGRHAEQGYDFCDTTHCQHTRGSAVPKTHHQAALTTRGLVISYMGRPIPAYYAAVCPGSLSPLPTAIARKQGYPDTVVTCPSCRQHSPAKTESGMPISPFSGATNGHGWGLCQSGALEMAQRGRSRDEILRHFFPHCTTLQWDSLK